MNIDAAIKAVTECRDATIAQKLRVDRKRSWRPSEKAMAKAAYEQRAEGLRIALEVLAKQQS